jgi:hypothetical protein
MARKQKTIHYLYRTTCLVTDRYYIGMHSTHNLDDGYMGSGKRLKASLRKHGVDNHKKEIIEFFESRDLLIEAEKTAITPEMITDRNCMNLMGGGKGGFISEEQQRYRSKCGGKAHSDKLKNDEEYRKIFNVRVGNNLKNYHKLGLHNYKTFEGKTHSEETKKLMSVIRSEQSIGKGNSQYGTCWITKEGYNKKIKKENLETYLKEGWVKGRK